MEEKKNFDSLDIFVFLWKKRMPLIIITVLGAIASIVVSLMIPNYFKAETVLFPTTFVSPSTSLLHLTVNQETDPLLIGDEDDLERLIQILNSDFIMNSIVVKYNLIDHYGLSQDDPHLKTKLQKTFRSNVSFQKTQYQGASVSVVDIDPQQAADMANDIASLVDSLVYIMQHQRIEESYQIAQEAYFNELAHVKTIEDSLNFYRSKGVPFYDGEMERYAESYTQAVVNGRLNGNVKTFFDSTSDSVKKYGAEAASLFYYLEFIKEGLANLHVNMTQAKANLDHPLTHKYVISYAQTPDKKYKPKRSIIVVFSTIGALVFAIVMLLLLDFYKEFRKRIKEEA
ncbi:MAG: hypothetical protein JXL97_13855 [Bacteroidales bacterium]|nr:hypothetical protein [Bacteroidales bacterium]